MKNFVLTLLISVLIGFGLFNTNNNVSTSNAYCNLIQDNSNQISVDTLINTYQKVYKGVVGIQTDEGRFGAIGSGFIYAQDSDYQYVLTNYHVVTTLATVIVRLYDGRLIEAEVWGTESSLDVALLRMEKQSGVIVLTTGNSDYVNIGEEVFAVGNPMSIDYHGHLSVGVVSGVRRLFNKVDKLEERQYLFQIDTPVNPGNSGGALFNVLGQVIGITSSKSVISYEGQSAHESIAFSLPINDVLTVASQLKTSHLFFPTTLGDNTVEDVNLMTRLDKEQRSIPANINSGVYIKSKDDTSIFYDIHADAIILTHVNDIEIIDSGHLRSLYFHLPPGYVLTFTYIKVLNSESSIEIFDAATLINR